MANKFVFNPLSGNFDLINDSSSIPSVQGEGDLPESANDGSLYIVRDTDQTYIYDTASALWTTTGIVINNVDLDTNPAGMSLTLDSDGTIVRPTLTLHVADRWNPGLVSIVGQYFVGVKNFTDLVIAQSGVDTNSNGILYLGENNAESIVIGGVATTITIGNNDATVIIQGTTEYQNVTNLNVQDKLITINKGGSITTGNLSGLEIEEGGLVTGYVKTSSDRNNWTLKAPGQSGEVIIDGGASGITLSQSSHDPMTIGTANGLSNSNQVISMALASNSVTGTLSSTDHTRFAADATIVEAATASQTPDTLVKRDINADTSIRHLLTSTGGRSVNIEGHVLEDTTGGSQLAWNTTGVSVNNLSPDYVVINNGSNQLRTSTTSNIELGYVTGVTSPIQTQLTNKADRNANDISLSTATVANNQAVAANVNGLLFANANVRSAQVQYSVTIATSGTSLFEEGTLRLVQRGADWVVARTFDGDDSLVNFDVTTTGQVTYTSASYTGFISGTLKFRAVITTT